MSHLGALLEASCRLAGLALPPRFSPRPPAAAQSQPADAKKPMTFLDVQKMRQVGSPAPSPDARLLLYTISTPDWKEARRQTDIHLVSLEKGSAPPGS
jgi:hypothetical protein